MEIKAAIRFKPYSSDKRVSTLVPGTTFAAEIYPTALRLFDIVTNKTILHREFPEFGRVTKFRVFLDLEKNRLEVTGVAETGFFRYFIKEGALSFEKKQESLPKKGSRLLLGCHKAQDSTLMFRRSDLTELMPIIHALSQTIPGDANCRLDKKSFLDFVETGFTSLFYPFALPNQGVQLSKAPYELLQSAKFFIEALFFQEKEREWHFLPALFPEFHSGTFVDLTTKAGHTLNIEWSKKTIRRVEIIPAIDDHYQFNFSNDIGRFRLSTPNGSSKVVTNGAEIALVKGQSLMLDRFER